MDPSSPPHQPCLSLPHLSPIASPLSFVSPVQVLLSTHGARFMRFNALIGSSATSTPEKMDQLLSMPGASFSIAVMIGGIFTSRSPASAISIVAEMRANGPFTKMALGGTCVLYVVSNIIFPVVRVVARVNGPRE